MSVNIIKFVSGFEYYPRSLFYISLISKRIRGAEYPEGHFVSKWTGLGIVFGAGVGIPLGLSIGNPAFFGIGLPVGLALGAAIGTTKEKEAKEAGLIRPLTKEEEKRKKLSVYAGIESLVLGLIVLLFIFLLR